MQDQGTHPAPRAAQAINGARRARTRDQFVAVVARQLHEIEPGTVRVRTVPVLVDDRRRTWVELVDSTGRPLATNAAACRAARDLLRRAFPTADWSRPRTYIAATGELAVDSLAAPAESGIDTAPAVTA
ncbi:hypothetical protein SEA_PICARD_35 [Streptomyces phage Picard]|uniref:Uncharacterized protein n=1 Tax=Streptomyces phage Picard TaxID=1920311 RepID=A0A1J0MC51_9CAUD|nr:hypothetical protein HOR45_gp35 [Streptomyces phage Picard]APD18565.1 hypothetical protein SEA_PICARD_35 [Streptomyces phage Picard]